MCTARILHRACILQAGCGASPRPGPTSRSRARAPGRSWPPCGAGACATRAVRCADRARPPALLAHLPRAQSLTQNTVCRHIIGLMASRHCLKEREGRIARPRRAEPVKTAVFWGSLDLDRLSPPDHLLRLPHSGNALRRAPCLAHMRRLVRGLHRGPGARAHQYTLPAVRPVFSPRARRGRSVVHSSGRGPPPLRASSPSSLVRGCRSVRVQSSVPGGWARRAV